MAGAICWIRGLLRYTKLDVNKERAGKALISLCNRLSVNPASDLLLAVMNELLQIEISVEVSKEKLLFPFVGDSEEFRFSIFGRRLLEKVANLETLNIS